MSAPVDLQPGKLVQLLMERSQQLLHGNMMVGRVPHHKIYQQLLIISRSIYLLYAYKKLAVEHKILRGPAYTSATLSQAIVAPTFCLAIGTDDDAAAGNSLPVISTVTTNDHFQRLIPNHVMLCTEV